ncbi:MAG: rod shape-determining protein MreC [Paludibacteraceae bacterium]|nr:rod shape-determining protein MreC [Paludibacteraceae bacterium]MBR1481107.1 rod shape-determining protein MreC [Paludibacteraceae bacterium]
MQDLLKFILRYGNFLVFLLLEVVALLLVLTYNDYPRSTAFSTANSLVATQYRMRSNVTDYFALKQTNNLLAEENAFLRSQLDACGTLPDDSVRRQNTQGAFCYFPARVIQADTYDKHNYLTIDRGAAHGLRQGMGVRSVTGAVGVVSTVGEHYAVIIPLIHTRSRLSCRFLKDGYVGTLRWDGQDVFHAMLDDVAVHEQVAEGDTIITSGLTNAFPEGVPVGVVEKCTLAQGASYYTIRLRLLTDFKRLRYVQVLSNLHSEEIESLTDGLD